VDLVRDRLQLLLEREARADIGLRGRVTQDSAHFLNPPCDFCSLGYLIFNGFPGSLPRRDTF
jgi:hypothetical protein